MTKIAVVDENDKVIGAEEREVVRQQGLCHRIVRVFVVNPQGLVLLQRRSKKLKDNPGKWDQSVGGHVDEGEDYLAAARRETFEELGIKVKDFQTLGKFYIERPAPGGVARRFQTVFRCDWAGPINFDPAEVAETKWLTMTEIKNWLDASPNDFTKNFAKAFELFERVL